MRQITIKDWLYLQNANELETISRVLDISIDALNKKSAEIAFKYGQNPKKISFASFMR